MHTCGCCNQLKQSLSCGVRCVACHVQVSLLLSFLGLHGVSVVFRLVRSWFVLQQWLSVVRSWLFLQQWLSVASVSRTFLIG